MIYFLRKVKVQIFHIMSQIKKYINAESGFFFPIPKLIMIQKVLTLIGLVLICINYIFVYSFFITHL